MAKSDMLQEIFIEICTENRSDKIEAFVVKLKDLFIDSVLNNTVEAISHDYMIDKRRAEAIETLLELEEEKNQIIYYYSAAKTIAEISVSIAEKSDLKQKISKGNGSERLFQILSVLYENGEVNHKVIAQRLQISTQALSNLIKRYDYLNLWSKNKQSKYCYYVITYEGKAFYREYLKKKILVDDSEDNLSKFTYLLLDSISKNINNDTCGSSNVISEMCIRHPEYGVFLTSKTIKYKIDSFIRRYQNERLDEQRQIFDKEVTPSLVVEYDDEWEEYPGKNKKSSSWMDRYVKYRLKGGDDT
ncbi:MAG: MarR family transcriptional regulator [Lachnospiraceae bacterium]|nr:MarR family transcriptional regulator [Lachnospiraceae bacterium]